MAFTAIRKRKSRIFEREKCKNTQKKKIYMGTKKIPLLPPDRARVKDYLFEQYLIAPILRQDLVFLS